MNQTAYRVMQETIRRSEQPFPKKVAAILPVCHFVLAASNFLVWTIEEMLSKIGR
jgi:hypothetical protein